MSNEQETNVAEAEVKNAYEDENRQQLLADRAKEVYEVLNKEPKMILVPFLRFNGNKGVVHAISPDVRIEFSENESNTESAEAGESQDS